MHVARAIGRQWVCQRLVYKMIRCHSCQGSARGLCLCTADSVYLSAITQSAALEKRANRIRKSTAGLRLPSKSPVVVDAPTKNEEKTGGEIDLQQRSAGVSRNGGL
jgi:hypothetical protein